MDFDTLLDHALALLRKRTRLSHRALRRQFELDDDLLEDLVFELVEGQQVARNEGAVLVWTGADDPGGTAAAPAAAPRPARPEPPAPASYTPKHLADKVLRSASESEGEIKHVTVLFCDLADSTALADRVGAEDMHTLLSTFFELSLAAVHTYEGTVNQFLGDGFMALFGAPIAHEDHARRAVRTAMKLQQALAEHHDDLGGPYGTQVKCRIGLNTGRVVIGGIGDDLRMDYTAVGDTSNVAARLQALAEPGEVLISESVAFAVKAETNLEALPPRAVKGKAEPIAAYRVLGVRRPHAGPMDLRGGRTLSPFVGRQDELDRMYQIATKLDQGQGHVIALCADAGVGKSRLAHEFRQRLAEAGRAFFEGRCVSFEHTKPYRPLLDIVREVAHLHDVTSPQEATAKIHAYLESRSLSPDEWAPYMLRLFGLDTGSSAIVGLTAEAIKARTIRMFCELVRQASQLRPLVIMIEDLHWIDGPSEDTLAELVNVADQHPVLLLFTYRMTYAAPWLDRRNVTHFELRRLRAEDGRSLVNAVLAQAMIPEDTLDAILAKAEGVPFFLEELTRTVLEAGGEGGAAIVPATIEGVITSRIDRLEALPKRILQTASVLGRRFTVALLREIWTETEGVEPLLAELQNLAFLTKEQEGGEPTYVFRHALIQDVAYGCMLTNRRRIVHAAAGEALERMYAGRLDDVLDKLAYHYARTLDADKAVQYLTAFAAKAADDYSHAAAAKALEQALEHAGRLEAEIADRKSLEICHQLSNSLYFLGKFPDTLALLEKCQPIVERLDDARHAGEFYFWYGHTCSYVGRMPEAFEYARSAIDYAEQCGDKLTEGRSAYVLERASFWSGKFPDAIEFGEHAIAALEEAGATWWQGQSLWMIGWSYGAMGEFARSLDAEDRTAAVGREIQDPRLPCYAAWTSAVMLAMRGDVKEAIAAGLRGLDSSPDLLNTGVAWGFTAFAYLEAGEADKAIDYAEQGAERMEQMGFKPLFGWFSIWGGEAHMLREDLERAEELVRQGMAVCDQIKNWWGKGMGLRVLGRIALARGDLDEAGRRLDEATAVFDRIAARYWAARAHLDQALLAHERQAAGEREAALNLARDLFAELDCEHWVHASAELATRCGTTLRT